jgi:hypothetical protein
MPSRRRILTLSIAALVAIGAIAAVWSQTERSSQQRQGRGFRGGDDGPVPVIATASAPPGR